MSIGKIVQVMGPVVDVEFESGDLPEMMTAFARLAEVMSSFCHEE